MKITNENKSAFNVNEMLEIFQKSNFLKINLTHECILKQLCLRNCVKQAEEYLESIINKNNESVGMIRFSKLTADSFNPLINYHFRMHNESEAIRFFKYMNELDIRPNSETYFELVNGYLEINEYEKALELFQNTNLNLRNRNLFDLFHKTESIKGNTINMLHENNFNVLNKLSKKSINFFNKEDENAFRIDCINTIRNLMKEGHVSSAYKLMMNLFKTEIEEDNPIKIDANEQIKINVANYFCKFLIRTNQPIEVITKYQERLDESFTENQKFYLKKIAFHALESCDENHILPMIERLSVNNIPIRHHFFASLIAKNLKNIDIDRVEDYNKDKVKQIIKIMIEKYNLFADVNDIKNLFFCFTKDILEIGITCHYHNHINSPKIYYFFIELFEEYSKQQSDATFAIINVFLVNSIQFLNECKSVEKLNVDFKLLIDVHNRGKSPLNDLMFSRNTKKYLDEMERVGLFKSYVNHYLNVEDNNLLKFVFFLIPFCTQTHIENESKEFLKEFIDSVILFYCKHRFLSENVDQREIKNFFRQFTTRDFIFTTNCLEEIKKLSDNGLNNKNLDIVIKLVAKNSNKNNSRSQYSNNFGMESSDIESREEIENKIKGLEMLIEETKDDNSKHNYMIELLELLCDNCCERTLGEKFGEKIKKIEKELPERNFDDKVLKKLFQFYSQHEIVYKRAKFYFENLMTSSSSMYHDLRVPEVLDYALLSFKNEADFNIVIKILKTFNYRHGLSDTAKVFMEFLNEMFFMCNASQLAKVIRIIEQNNYTDMREKDLRNSLMIKRMIEDQSLSDAIDFYQKYRKDNWLNTGEIDLLCEILMKNDYKMNNNEQLDKMFKIISNDSYAFNCLFIALIQENQIKKAENILIRHLKSEIDFYILDNTVDNYFKSKKIYAKNISKIFKNFQIFCKNNPNNSLSSSQNEKLLKLFKDFE